MKNEGRKQQSSAYSYLLLVGHACCDMNQSTVPAMLPFLVAQRGIAYTAAAGLMFANSSFSSLIQPMIGIIADHRQMPWLMGLGILMTGLGISAVGFLDGYWGIFTVLIIAGVGSALFHPEGARMANCVAGEKKGSGMSIFTTGGSVGFAFGPVVVAFAVSVFGFKGTTLVLIPTITVFTTFFCLRKKFRYMSDMMQHEVEERAAAGGQKDYWLAFLRLCVPIFARSITISALNTFIPLYWVGVLLQSQRRGSLMVTCMALASIAAAFMGGRFADRFGFRRIIRISLAAASPMIVLMLITKNI